MHELTIYSALGKIYRFNLVYAHMKKEMFGLVAYMGDSVLHYTLIDRREKSKLN